LEQGLPGEPKAHDTISNGDYDGAPKGSPKSFVARYNKRGIILFADGNAEEVSAKKLLTNTGGIEWSENAASDSSILWTADPRENPNTLPAP
jgi:prepilin-type processing-associated H-X9-DG protein